MTTHAVQFGRLPVARLEYASLARMSASELRVYVALAMHVDADWACRPTIQRLATLTGLHRRTVQRAIDELNRNGDARVFPGGGRGRATRYELVTSVLPTDEKGCHSSATLSDQNGRQSSTGKVATPSPNGGVATPPEQSGQKRTHTAVCANAAPGESENAELPEIRTLLQSERVLKLEVANLEHVTLAATRAVIAEAPRGKGRPGAIVRMLEDPDTVARLIAQAAQRERATPTAEETRQAAQAHIETEAAEQSADEAEAKRLRAAWDTMSPDDRNAVTRRAWERMPAIVRPPLESVLADPWGSPNLRPHLISELRKLADDDTTDTQTEPSQPNANSENLHQTFRSA